MTLSIMAVMLGGVSFMVSVVYAECPKQTDYDEFQNAECRKAERHYAECRGAQGPTPVEQLTRFYSVIRLLTSISLA
jgi:hypothetical protein